MKCYSMQQITGTLKKTQENLDQFTYTTSTSTSFSTSSIQLAAKKAD